MSLSQCIAIKRENGRDVQGHVQQSRSEESFKALYFWHEQQKEMCCIVYIVEGVWLSL